MTSDVSDRWSRAGLVGILADIIAQSAKPNRELTVEDLAPLDQFHANGRDATFRLARLLAPESGAKVLDVGGGLGGPARMLAAEFGCSVTVVDPTEDYLNAGEMLTSTLGLNNLVRFDLGEAPKLLYQDQTFDVVWTQNSGMNVQDKAAMYAEFFRILRKGGRLATQEPTEGTGGSPRHFPMMWADDPATSFLVSRSSLVATITAAGFVLLAEADGALPAAPPIAFATEDGASYTIQALVMGDRLPAIQAATDKNRAEGRQDGFIGVFARP